MPPLNQARGGAWPPPSCAPDSIMHKYIHVCIIQSVPYYIRLAYNIAHAYCLRFGLKGRELNTMLLLSPNFYSMHNSLSSTLLLSLSFSALSISLPLSLTLSLCSLPVCTLKYKHCELYSRHKSSSV